MGKYFSFYSEVPFSACPRIFLTQQQFHKNVVFIALPV